MLGFLIRRAPDEHLEDAAHVRGIGPWWMAPAVCQIDGPVVVHHAAYGRRTFLIREPHRELRARRSPDQHDAARIAPECPCFLRDPVERRTDVDDLLGPLPLGSVTVIDGYHDVASFGEVP